MLYNLRIDNYKIDVREIRDIFSDRYNEINEIPLKLNDTYYGCSEKEPLIKLGYKYKMN